MKDKINRLTVGGLIELCKHNGLNLDTAPIVYCDICNNNTSVILTWANINNGTIEVNPYIDFKVLYEKGKIGNKSQQGGETKW